MQELLWFFNYFCITSKYLYENCTIAKSSATAKFHTNYQINFFEGCDDLIVSGVQKLLTKNNLISIKLLDFLTFGSPYLEQNIFEIKSKKVKNDRHLYYKKQESKKILVIYIIINVTQKRKVLFLKCLTGSTVHRKTAWFLQQSACFQKPGKKPPISIQLILTHFQRWFQKARAF